LQRGRERARGVQQSCEGTTTTERGESEKGNEWVQGASPSKKEEGGAFLVGVSRGLCGAREKRGSSCDETPEG